MKWIQTSGPLGDVVLSTRIRLARNLADFPFPSAMDDLKAQKVLYRIKDSVLCAGSRLKDGYKFMAISDISELDREVLVENHSASPTLMEHHRRAGLILGRDDYSSIMVNEEDHIRLQSIFPGYQLKELWQYINGIDDIIEQQLSYAFDEKLGYLTCCPTNVGTGMRASVMMHLPTLVLTGNMTLILQTLSKIGLTVRGLYGEGSETMGHIYQISNQVTLGASEEEIIQNLEMAAEQIIEKERMARLVLAQSAGIKFRDRVWRAFGILANARTIDIKEFMDLLSQVRVGVEMDIIPNMSLQKINELMILGQPGHLKKYAVSESGEDDLDIIRAEVARKKLE